MYDEVPSEELILRDHLAIDRTKLANERTFLAYVRTALMLLVTGASAVKFVGKSHDVIITGWIFIGLGFVVGIIGTSRFLKIRQRINTRRILIKRNQNAN
jgi:putative membrane protein